jgi:hypothetical protein
MKDDINEIKLTMIGESIMVTKTELPEIMEGEYNITIFEIPVY